MKKLLAIVGVVYDKLGDPRSKNALLFILLAMTAFGILDPERATNLRDTILKMAL
jgi:hypothetical protein